MAMELHRVPARVLPPVPQPPSKTEVRYLKGVLPFFVIGLLLFAAAGFSLYQRAGEWLREGIGAENAGRIDEAIQSYEWAIQAYTPASSPVREAIHRLELIAGNAERGGDYKTARKAYQAIVSGLSVIEHFAQPYSMNLQDASRDLERIERAMMPPQAVSSDVPGATSIQPVSPN